MLVMCLSRCVCTIRSHSNRSWPFENFLCLAPRVVVVTKCLENGLFWYPNQVTNGSKMSFSKDTFRLAGVLIQVQRPHFESMLSELGPSFPMRTSFVIEVSHASPTSCPNIQMWLGIHTNVTR